MDLKRRSFLGGALALAGARLLPRIPSYLPTVFLDGVHDDGPGLNALLRGDPVAILNEAAVSRPLPQWVQLSQAMIFTREPIYQPVNGPILDLFDCHVKTPGLPADATELIRLDGQHVLFSIYIEAPTERDWTAIVSRGSDLPMLEVATSSFLCRSLISSAA